MPSYRASERAVRSTRQMMQALQGAYTFRNSVENLVREARRLMDALEDAAGPDAPVNFGALPCPEKLREALAPFEEVDD